MKICFKIMCYEYVEIPEQLEQRALDLVKSGKIETSNQLFDWLTEEGKEGKYGILQDSEIYLDQIFALKNSEEVWSNEKKEE